MFKCLVIAGTPGVGKTSVARIIAEKVGGLQVDLSELVVNEGLYEYFDDQTGSYVIDEARVSRRVKEICSGGRPVVVATHYPEVLDEVIVDKVAVLRLNPVVLWDRLRSRGWSDRKVAENVMAEVLSVVLSNAISKFGVERVVEVDTTGRSIIEVADEVLEKVSKGYTQEKFIDWLNTVDPGFLEELERVLSNEQET
jgi:adenylate kinase